MMFDTVFQNPVPFVAVDVIDKYGLNAVIYDSVFHCKIFLYRTGSDNIEFNIHAVFRNQAFHFFFLIINNHRPQRRKFPEIPDMRQK